MLGDEEELINSLPQNLKDLPWIALGVKDALYRYQEYITFYTCMDNRWKRILFSLTEEDGDLNSIMKSKTSLEQYSKVLKRVQQRERTEELSDSEKKTMELQIAQKINQIIELLSKGGMVQNYLFGGEALMGPFGLDYFNIVGTYQLLHYFWKMSRIYIWDLELKGRLKLCIRDFFTDAQSYCHQRRIILQANLIRQRPCHTWFYKSEKGDTILGNRLHVNLVSIYTVSDYDNFLLKLLRRCRGFKDEKFCVPFLKKRSDRDDREVENFELIIYTSVRDIPIGKDEIKFLALPRK
jgi:hypothetical protein